jgi:hypothetical protein
MTRGGIRAALAALTIVGAAACDGQLPPSDPPATAVDVEGLPILAALPQVSGACTLSNPPYRVLETVSWDAGTRTFTKGDLYWKLDERGRTVEYGQLGGDWRHLMTRDEHGVLTAFTYEWNGGPNAENSWDQTNAYGPDGRLTGSAAVFRSGTRQTNSEYGYEDGRLVSITTVSQSNGLLSENFVTLTWQGGRPVSRERGSGPALRGRDTRFYDGAGRLIGVDVDGGGLGTPVDGTMDMRRTWSYDASGRLVHHEQDGTEAFDAPFIDGVPDSAATFDTACAPIAALPLVLYQLESWLRLP